MKKGNIKNIFKGTSFCLLWLFVGILIGIFVLSYVQGWFNQLINDLSFATGMMAIGTFFLAFITYWNIHSRNAREKRDRKEQSLDEIINWLREIKYRIYNRPSIDVYRETQEDINLVDSLVGVSPEDILRNRAMQTTFASLDNMRIEIRNGEYFKKLAFNLDPTLSELINNILCPLKQRIKLTGEGAKYPISFIRSEFEKIKTEYKAKVFKLVMELIKDDTKPLEGLELSKENINTVLMGRNAGHIGISINKAIDKAIEIKTALW